MSQRRRYKYYTVNSDGNMLMESNDEWFIKGYAELSNSELRQRLVDIKIGRYVIKKRFKVLREIDKSNQEAIPFQ